MKAIVLSAGQGKRLLPLTTMNPKCLLAVDGNRSMLELQLSALERCGVEHTTVLVGFGADQVERCLETCRFDSMSVNSLYNPFFSVSDNLATCWMARSAMTGDFLLLNGDTLFEDDLLERVLAAPSSPISVTIDRKEEYDADDMKVTLDTDGRLRAIGKTLPLHTVDGESIGILRFCETGVKMWRDTLDRSIRQPESLRNWYLSVVHEMAQKMAVETLSIEGSWWGEVDCPDDLAAVRSHYLEKSERGARAAAGSNG